MLFKNLTTRKYLGLAMITLSIILILTQFGPIFPVSSFFSAQDKGTIMSISFGGLIIGAYLVAGPLGAVITSLSIAGSGCGGGGGKVEPKDEDLGKPPEPPPNSLSSRFWFLQ